MAIPLIPIAGLALGALATLSLLALQNLAQDREFDGNPSLPLPTSQVPPFVPPFLGGQCVGNPNRGYFVRITRFYNPNTETEYTNPDGAVFGNGRAVNTGRSVASVVIQDTGFFQSWKVTDSTGQVYDLGSFGGGNTSGDIPITDFTVAFLLYDYSTSTSIPDSCGDLPNPNSPIPPSSGGGNLSPIPTESPEIYHAGAIVPVLGGILSALAALAASISTIGAVLDGVRKIGEAIDKIREWLEEKEKEKEKSRTIWAGRWVSMGVEGGTELITQLIDGKVLSPFQVQIEIEAFPLTCSRRVGTFSPSFASEEPIGYLFVRSANGGYSEPVPLRFLRNSVSINEDTRGLSFSFRQHPLARAKMRVWYSSPPV